MPLTTVARGRCYDWSHAIGRGAATGTGFNYVQTMALDKNGNIYTANRGNENNFGMRVNHVKVGGPHEEELLAEFFQYGEEEGKAIWPFGVAVDNERDRVYCSDEWTNTISVFDTAGKYITKFGETGSGDGQLLRPAGLAVEKSGNLIVVDSGNDRLQVFSPDGKFVAKCGGSGKNPGQFNQPWGVTLDKDGNIYVADWKNHRIQKLSPAGKPLMCLGSYGKVEETENSYAVTTLGPFVAGESERAGHPRTDQFNHPTDVAIDSDGDIYVCDWGNHRVCVFDSEGVPVTTLIGDAHELSKWGKMSVDANPDMMKARRRVKSLEPSWRFCFRTAVDFDAADDRLLVADGQRNRVQVYNKVRDYTDFHANL